MSLLVEELVSLLSLPDLLSQSDTESQSDSVGTESGDIPSSHMEIDRKAFCDEFQVWCLSVSLAQLQFIKLLTTYKDVTLCSNQVIDSTQP